MSTITHNSAQSTQIVLSKIRGLRLRVMLWLFLDGLAVLLLCALGLAIVDFFIDFQFRMDKPQRIVSLAILGMSLGCVLFLRILRPLAQPISDESLCLQVEQRHRELGQSLISALEFSRLSGDPTELGISPRMIQATIEQGVSQSSNIDFGGVLNVQRFWTNVLGCGIVMGIFGGVFFAYPVEARTWFDRNVLLGDMQWPARSRITVLGVKDGVIKCRRNASKTIIVEADSDLSIPDEIFIEIMGGENPIKMERDHSKSTFSYKFSQISKDFTFRIVGDDLMGDDAQTQPILMKVIDPPALIDELAFRVEPPSYMDVASIDLPGEEKKHELFAGSGLTVSGKCNKKLRSARLLTGEKNNIQSYDVKVDGDRFELNLGKRDQLSVDKMPLTSGVYRIALTGVDGELSWPHPTFEILVVSDAAPIVDAKRQGIGKKILSRAKLPLDITVVDDVATNDVWIEYRVLVEKTDEEIDQERDDALKAAKEKQDAISEENTAEENTAKDKKPVQTIRPPTIERLKIVAAGKMPVGSIWDKIKVPLGTKKTEFLHVVDLQKVRFDGSGGEASHDENPTGEKNPAGDSPAEDAGDSEAGNSAAGDSEDNATTSEFENGLTVGMTLELTIVARDGDVLSQKNAAGHGIGKEGRSVRLAFEIVTESQLAEEFAKKELNQQKELVRRQRRQETLQVDCEEMLVIVRGAKANGEGVSENLLNQLFRAEEGQLRIAKACVRIASELTKLTDQAENNRLEGRYTKPQFTRTILVPLVRISEQFMPRVAQHLRTARSDDQQRQAELEDAVDIQIDIIAQMSEVLLQMKKSEGLDEILMDLRRILNEQRRLKKKTGQKTILPGTIP